MKRVWFDDARGVLVVTGSKTGAFPARSLIAALEGAFVRITLADGETVVLYDDWQRVAGSDGLPFVSAQAALAYLTGEFAREASDPNLPGDGIDIVGTEIRLDIHSLPLAP